MILLGVVNRPLIPILETPGEAMYPESPFYVERKTDEVALSTIIRSGGVTIPIKGPRQMGKSSLLMRMIDDAARSGKRVVYLDFQLFDRKTFEDICAHGLVNLYFWQLIAARNTKEAEVLRDDVDDMKSGATKTEFDGMEVPPTLH